jgi:hypothetical protein
VAAESTTTASATGRQYRKQQYSNQGGGIDNSKTLFVTDSTISGNSAAGGIGGASPTLLLWRSNVFNTTIVFNVAGQTPVEASTTTHRRRRFALRNTLVANNYAPPWDSSTNAPAL